MQLKPEQKGNHTLGTSDLSDDSETTSESEKEDGIFNTISNVFSSENPHQNTRFNSPPRHEVKHLGKKIPFCKPSSSDLDETLSNRPGTSDSGISTLKLSSITTHNDENESVNSESTSEERRNISCSEDSSLQTSSSSSASSSSSSLSKNNYLGLRRKRKHYNKGRQKWSKTAEVLRKSGLLDITIKTAELMRKNQEVQKEIELLQEETNKFVMSVLSNPENKHILDGIYSYSQLCEAIVPGSQQLIATSSVVPEEKRA